MTVQEIRQALAIKPEDREGKVRLLGDNRIYDICAPIVEETGEYLQFVHFTVKELVHSRIHGRVFLTRR